MPVIPDYLFGMPPRDASVFLALMSKEDDLLLIRQPDHRSPVWKFPAGRREPGETVMETFAREGQEETGFLIPPPTLVDGKPSLVIPGSELHFVHKFEGARYDRYLFLIRVLANPLDFFNLDRRSLKEDDEELLETRIFKLKAVQHMPDFLWHAQADVYQTVVGYAARIPELT